MAARPNVLILMSDQHNRHIAGFAGNSIVQTPNLDRLASESVRFDAAYCQTPLCTPSRISFWTGRLPHRAAAWKNNSPIFPEFVTLPEYMANYEYATCGVGKMHVGGRRPMNGFQFRPYGDLKPNRFCGHQPDPVETAKDQAWTRHDIGHFPYAGETEIPESLLQDSVVTKESLTFVLNHHAKHPDQPWLLCASYSRPHHPLTAPGRYFRRYWPEGPELQPLPDGYPEGLHPHDRFIVDDFRLAESSTEEQRKGLSAYYASVDFLDDCIGELLHGLEKNGLLENTIVVYTADHGDLASEHGLWWKRSYYDGSVGVPLLVRIPGRTQSMCIGTVVELLDIFPTLCELCGVPVPGDLDGESLLPLLENRGDRKKALARSEHIMRLETSFRMVRMPEWKYVEFPEFPPVLFDMENDPGETRNLADMSEYRTASAELQARLWEDGETWDSLYARRQVDMDRASQNLLVYDDATPNQYALPNGTVVDAESMLYSSILERENT